MSFRYGLFGLGLAVAVAVAGVGRAQDVYVANQVADTVTVYEAADPSNAAAIAVGDQPHEIGIHPLGRWIYVTNLLDGTVSVLDGGTRTEVDTDGDPTNGLTRVAAGTWPHGVAVSPDGQRVFVTNAGSDDVTVFDGTGWQGVATVPNIGGAPHMARFTPDGQQVWVVNRAGGTVQVLDPQLAVQSPSSAVIATFPVGALPEGVAFTPGGSMAFVANSGSFSVSAIDTATLAATPIAVGDTPLRVEVAPDGQRAYVTNVLSSSVSVIDVASLTVTTTFTGVTNPVGMAFSPDATRLLVAGFQGTVFELDPLTGAVLGTVPAGGGADGIVHQPPVLVQTAPAQPGATATFLLRRPPDAGLAYQAACSLAQSPGIPAGPHQIPLSPDPLFFLSLTTPSVFMGFAGVTGPSGEAALAIAVPPDPGLTGLQVFLSAVTLDPTAPAGIATVAPALSFPVQ